MSESSLQGVSERESRNLLSIWATLVFSIAAAVLLGSTFADTDGANLATRATGMLPVTGAAIGWGVAFLSLSLLVAATWISHHHLGEQRVLAHADGASSEERMQNGLSYLRFYTLLSWGLVETVVLMGPAWAILSGQPLAVFPFAIAGGTALFLLKPEQVPLMQLAARMSKPL